MKWTCLFVVVFGKGINSFDELSNRLEGPPADGFLCDDIEPDFYLVQPGSVGWRVVDVVSRPFCQPSLHLLVFVSAVIVDHEVNIEVDRHVLVDVI